MKIPHLNKEQFIRGFVLIVRLGLGCLFLWSSSLKLLQPYDFLSNVYSYELVGPKLGMLTAIILPWLELFVGLCLIGGIFVSGALVVTIGMAALFTFTLSLAVYKGLEITCGCFGDNSEVVNFTTVLRAIGLMLLSAAVYAVSVFRPRLLSESS